MHAFRCVVATLLVIGLAGAASAAHHEGELMKEAAALGDTLATAMVENDVDTMLGMFAEDAISLPNFSPRMDGVEAFRQQNEMMTAAGMKVLSFDSSPTEVWEAGDQVIEIGTYEISLVMPGMPDAINDIGKYLTVYVRDDEGSLNIKVETWNTDINPMEMGQGLGQ